VVGNQPSPTTSAPADSMTGFRASLPLMVGSAALFIASVLAGLARLQLGAARIPLSVLLVMLGFIAAVGAAISWLYTERETVTSSALESGASPPAPSSSGRPSDYGRPRPDVVSPAVTVGSETAPPAPWDEGLVETPPPSRALRRARPWTAEDSAFAIRELERIQQEVATRRKRPGSDQ
jgi:hypothetical protein